MPCLFPCGCFHACESADVMDFGKSGPCETLSWTPTRLPEDKRDTALAGLGSSVLDAVLDNRAALPGKRKAVQALKKSWGRGVSPWWGCRSGPSCKGPTLTKYTSRPLYGGGSAVCMYFVYVYMVLPLDSLFLSLGRLWVPFGFLWTALRPLWDGLRCNGGRLGLPRNMW